MKAKVPPKVTDKKTPPKVTKYKGNKGLSEATPKAKGPVPADPGKEGLK